jgi:hypothetical protein
MGEFEKRGKQFYVQNILPSVTSNDNGKFAAIDIETGMFELDSDDYTASERLFARNPDAQIWLERVGSPTAYQVGCGSQSEASA